MTGKKWTLLLLSDERERLREITLGTVPSASRWVERVSWESPW
jgi:hypothetical protein